MPTAPTPAPASAPTPDPVLETQVLWERHKTTIIAVVAVLLLAGAVFGGYRMYMAHREDAAARLLSSARTVEQYQQVIGSYSNAGAAAGARLLMAAELRKQGKFEEANRTLREFIEGEPRHQMVTTAMMGVAANLESLGRGDEALEMYRRVASEHPQSYSAPMALLAQVTMLRAKGQTEEARRVCETIISQHSGSYAAMEAQRHLRTLKPATPAPAAATPAPDGAETAPPPDAQAAPSPAVEAEPPAPAAAPTP